VARRALMMRMIDSSTSTWTTRRSRCWFGHAQEQRPLRLEAAFRSSQEKFTE
jgi:hypothetical protein